MKQHEKLTRDPAAREMEVLSFWRERDTFRKTLAATEGGPRFVFYEGPPTANGMPHFGHLMPRVYKDLFPRYKTMQGFYVARKGGWDTHGLPVELEVEKEIGVDSKPEIEAYGVERFVEKCKESVWRYKGEWERMIERMGFWLDLENAYVTYADDYIETVWWALKTMFDRGLLYRGHKTLPYCPRCGTGLSSHEVAQGYRTVEDPSVIVRMPVVGDAEVGLDVQKPSRTSLLTWTTTPWTLPANVALAVAKEAAYVEVVVGGERFLLAQALVDKVFAGREVRVLRELRGIDLVGVRYEPPYRLTEEPAAHRVYAADFVNMEDGTGIVHIASAFGEDDYRLGQEVGLPFVQPVDAAGRFTEGFALCAGEFVKDADARIIDDLRARGILYRLEGYEHEYPFCWRCDTPLLYYAVDSWYIRTTALKDAMIENNARIQWIPAHVGEGRLGDFLANLKDWALSRDRYWGTPLNLWICGSCGEVTCIGSRAELVGRALDPGLAGKVELHRPYVDAISVRCRACGEAAIRVPYVVDTWFDSGSMHTAQWHYPFENEEIFRDQFPADFICEAMEQTRGWFYTMLATSTILHGVAPYRTCVSTGLGLDENGLKMSKSRGNVLDPRELTARVGADCIRWYLYSTSTPWKTRRLSEKGVQEPLYRFLDTIRNTYDFFALYASIDGYDPTLYGASPRTRSILDRWLLSRLQSTTGTVVGALDRYDVVAAAAALETIVDDLSNWYVRLSRRRFWRGGMGDDKIVAYGVLRAALIELCKLLAPFVPFLSEAVYRKLRAEADPESVHLCRYPLADETAADEELEAQMAVAREIAALGHQARSNAQIRVRQPLSRVIVELEGNERKPLGPEICSLIAEELNVRSVEFVESAWRYYETRATPNFASLGPRLGPHGRAAGDWIRTQDAAALSVALARGPLEAEIAGTRVQVRPEDVTFEPSIPPDLVPSRGNGIHLLLDQRLDDHLRERGRVRELTHRIQLARKEAGFEVTDRIELRFRADSPLRELVESNRDEIADEVLATAVVEGIGVAEEYHQTFDLDGKSITIGLSRVAAAPGRA